MHSRIYQITTEPVRKDDFITEADFYDHWFTNSIADYVDDDVDRINELEYLRGHLEGQRIAVFDLDYSFVILPNGKMEYFKRAYDEFLSTQEKISHLQFQDFVTGSGDFGHLLYTMNSAYCDKYESYVSSDEFDTITFDEFIRGAEIGRQYFIGGILDYHF